MLKKAKKIQRIIIGKKNILHRFLIKKTTTIKNKLYFNKKKNFDYSKLQLITLNESKTTNKECTKNKATKNQKKRLSLKE